MVFSSISGSDQIDNIARPVFSLFTETTFIGEIEPHAHNKAQFLYVISGVLTVEAVGGIWTIPPQCGLWIPGGVLHAGRISGHINIGNLYIDPTLTTQLPKNCGIIFVAPLLRELLLRFDRSSVFQMQDKAREARLLSVLLDELAAAPLEPIHLPMPTDRRLRRLTEAMINFPQLRFTVNEWGVRVGASSRTLSPLFNVKQACLSCAGASNFILVLPCSASRQVPRSRPLRGILAMKVPARSLLCSVVCLAPPRHVILILRQLPMTPEVQFLKIAILRLQHRTQQSQPSYLLRKNEYPDYRAQGTLSDN